MLLYYLVQCYGDARGVHSFPTRRSSDLALKDVLRERQALAFSSARACSFSLALLTVSAGQTHNKRDRKSTRLNSSHGYISYAVFCLKKKKQTTINNR